MEELEQINPYDQDYRDFWIKIEHLGRYLFVKDFIKSKQHAVKGLLDAAAGYGYGAEILADVCHQVFALDNNPNIYNVLQNKFKNYKNIHPLHYDLENSRLSELNILCPLQMIISFETLEHLTNPEKVIAEFSDVLDDNGILILSVPNENFESLDEKGSPVSEFHKTVLPDNTIVNMLERNNFEVMEKYGQSLLNRLMKRENKLFRKKKIVDRFSNLEVLQEKENIFRAAYLFAYPGKENIEMSYSRIYIARKK